MQRYSPAADVKATSYMAANGDGAYYLASEVDARIAKLENATAELLAYIEANGADATAHLLIGKYSKLGLADE